LILNYASQPLILYNNSPIRAVALVRRLMALDYRNVCLQGGGIVVLLALQAG
jgi:hypothetical protein